MLDAFVPLASYSSQYGLQTTGSGGGGALVHESDLPLVTVKFILKYKTSWGQAVKITGSHPKLGSWKLSQGLDMKWAEGDQWVATVTLPAPSIVEYKYVVVEYGTTQPVAWQTGSNAVLALEAEDLEVDVYDNWGNAPGSEVRDGEDVHTRETKLQKWAETAAAVYKQLQKAETELVAKRNENDMLRSEAARLRMELSLSKRAETEAEARVLSLEAENTQLASQLQQSQLAMQNTLHEALHLLELEDEGEAAVNGGSDNSGSSGGGGWSPFGGSQDSSGGFWNNISTSSSNGNGSTQPKETLSSGSRYSW